MTNLLDNSIKFSPTHGQIFIGLSQMGDHVAISVVDTGPGIEFEERQRLFERFYRGAIARTTGITGAGLGLALAQAIARNYGGFIEVSNRRDKGAIFNVNFPLSD